MDSTLVTVTLLSMAMAVSLSVIVWRMLRDERQRSEARVIALTTKSRVSHAEPRSPVLDSRPSILDSRVSTLDSRASALDLPIREAAAPSAPMFAEREAVSPWGSRVAVMAGLGLVIASAILFSLTANGRDAIGRAAASPGTTAAVTPGAAPAAAAGLELLSLRDSRQPGSLTITGLVHNPRGGATLSRVSVTAYAFDDKGSFLASGRALIDVTALASGDESPFVVSVPVTETVARYRIGFRSEDGRVIAHIDKRQQAPIASLRFDSEQALRPGSGQGNP